MTIDSLLRDEAVSAASDYETVRAFIELLTNDYRDQPSLEVIAAQLKQWPTRLHDLFVTHEAM